MWGFDTIKDVLEVVLVPAIGGAIALAWPELQRRYKRRRFEGLIKRELGELRPFPQERTETSASWTDHQKKNFLHKQIIQDVSKNRNFILSLDPDLVYELSQLWDARTSADGVQWLWYLECLAKRYNGEVAVAHGEWSKLIASFKRTGRLGGHDR